jgi:chromosome segregation ATPase
MSKNLQCYMGKLEKYIAYLERNYAEVYGDLCDTNDEYNEILKLKTKSINQFQQLTERSNKANSTLGITKMELARAKEKRNEHKSEVKELKGQLGHEKKKTKQLEAQVTTSSQPTQDPVQVTMQRLQVEKMDKELALERVKAETAILIDQNKARCQDQLHDNKVRRTVETKEAARDSLKEKKKGRQRELVATSSRGFGLVSVCCAFLFYLFTAILNLPRKNLIYYYLHSSGA